MQLKHWLHCPNCKTPVFAPVEILCALLWWVPFAVIIVFALLAVSCGERGAYPEPTAPVSSTLSCSSWETGLRTEVSDRAACYSFEGHETIASFFFRKETTATTHGSPVRTLDGWTVVIRADGWSEKYQRAYFTDATAPGWLLWGLVDFDSETIFLADDVLMRAVLVHEECHVLFPPPFTHADWPRLGCDRVERDVAETLALASGVYDGSATEGVYDPAEFSKGL